MNLSIQVVCVFFLILSYINFKNIYNPMFIFNIWWLIIIVVSGLGLFDLEIPSDITYGYILIAILSYNVPFVFAKSKHIQPINKVNAMKKDLRYINKYNRIIILSQILTLFILGRRSLRVIRMISLGIPYNNIRYYYYYSDKIISNSYEMILTNIFFTPIVIVGIIIIGIQFFDKKNWKVFVLALINSLLYSFSSGSRGIIVYIMISVVTSYLINGNIKKYQFKNKFKLYSSIILIIIFLTYMTIFRSQSQLIIDDLLRTVVLYFTGSIIYFEKLMEVIPVNVDLTYGLSFFGGIIDIIIMPFQMLGFEIKQTSQIIGMYNQQYLNIGGNNQFNAFSTMLYTFYHDFGKYGFFTGPLFFGILSKGTYRKLVKSNNIFNLSKYILVVIMIYESTLRWWGIFSNFWIPFLFFTTLEYLNRSRGETYEKFIEKKMSKSL